jgi:hypothetical protein
VLPPRTHNGVQPGLAVGGGANSWPQKRQIRAACCTDSAQSGQTFSAGVRGSRESMRISGERSRTPDSSWLSALSQ